MTIVADAGPLYALMDQSDSWHARVVAWWGEQPRRVVVPVSVLPEVSYLLQTRIGPAAEQAFIGAVVSGEFITEPLEPEDTVRALQLMQEYGDLPLSFVDATVVAIAERLGAREILTTDRRHFGVIRPLHTSALVLVP